jgi:hypothetical protein
MLSGSQAAFLVGQGFVFFLLVSCAAHACQVVNTTVFR